MSLLKPYFIAEIGINHHGSYEKARHMIEMAKIAGASAVKTQYYDVDKVLGKEHPENAYAKACQLTKLSHEKLAYYAKDLKMDFAVSVFNNNDLPWASDISDFLKIATRMNKKLDFIHKCIDTKKPIIMSIQSYAACQPIYRMDYLWCVPEYPSTALKCLNFTFDEHHGLSSHCPDWKVTVDAWVRGARVFENHVCESKEEQGCDIPASLDFSDYTKVIDAIKSKTADLAA